jgi:8-oxo-dGTP pyrophosphatase MutT (NUDIX family)
MESTTHPYMRQRHLWPVSGPARPHHSGARPRFDREGARPTRPSAGARRLLYRLWPRVPLRVQRLVRRLVARPVTLGACAVIQDAGGRVLLAHHTYRRRAWGLPGGLVGPDEQPMDALARELCEEAGVPAAIGPLLCAEADTAGRHLTLYYRATLAGQPRPDGVEIDAYRYATLDEAPELLGTPTPPWLPATAGRWGAGDAA